jgi:hypothetical protein
MQTTAENLPMLPLSRWRFISLKEHLHWCCWQQGECSNCDGKDKNSSKISNNSQWVKSIFLKGFRCNLPPRSIFPPGIELFFAQWQHLTMRITPPASETRVSSLPAMSPGSKDKHMQNKSSRWWHYSNGGSRWWWAAKLMEVTSTFIKISCWIHFWRFQTTKRGWRRACFTSKIKGFAFF